MSFEDKTSLEYLVSSRQAFNEFVYTGLDESISIISKRSNDLKLDNYIKKMYPHGVPQVLKEKTSAILSRDLATPNFETRKFIDVINKNKSLSPLFWEYYGDLFRPNVNKYKYSIGKLTFYNGIDKKGGEKVRRISIIDFNLFNGKMISDIKTLWGESFVDFHHNFLKDSFLNNLDHTVNFFDATSLYKEVGGGVSVYYKYILVLLLRHGILFEDFILDDPEELKFIKNIFLPAFIEVYMETGYKPLIVSMAPIESESANFWSYYPNNSIEFIKNKINLI